MNDRFTETKAGWADISLYIQFDVPEYRHAVAEVQIVHDSLMLVREEMGAHDSYEKERFAAELCKSRGGTQTVSPARCTTSSIGSPAATSLGYTSLHQ